MLSRSLLSQHSAQQPAKNIALVLLASQLSLISFSLFETVFTWILLLVVCGAVIRVAIFTKHYKHLPSSRTLNLLALLSILGLVYSGLNEGLLFGMTNLLILACALKLMQMRHQKDVHQLVVSMLFLVGCGFIFNQSIILSVFYAFMTLTLLLSLACYHAPSIKFTTQIRLVTKLSLQALPIGLLMFLVLPQLSPLWHTPRGGGAQTGLSDQITPGDIASLSQSSELAFRATFTGEVPANRELYWRAIVMEEFDGKSWRVHPYRQQLRDAQLQHKQQFKPKLQGDYWEYEVIAEPTSQHWLFALDLAQPLSGQNRQNVMQSGDFLLFSRRQLVNQYQYGVRSYPQALPAQDFTIADNQLNLLVPEKGNPRTREWVAELRDKFPVDQDFVASLLDYFVAQPFIYTLRPKLMLVDPVDRFLFDNQSGFCSHYASALAYSLRLGGIPARVVTGYQGGERVKDTGEPPYLSVYQYDAHAWVESWSQGTGWRRIDPTALVSPDRIEFGLRQAMADEGSFLADSPFSLARMSNIKWLNGVRLFLADIDYNWSRWVLGFNRDKQQALFKSILGQLTPQKLSILGVSIVLIIAVLLGLFFLPHWRKKPVDKTLRLYLKAIQIFEKAGTKRHTWQGPVEFSQLITERYPVQISQPFAVLTQLYLRLTYQHVSTSSSSTLSLKQCHVKMRRQLLKLTTELPKHQR